MRNFVRNIILFLGCSNFILIRKQFLVRQLFLVRNFLLVRKLFLVRIFFGTNILLFSSNFFYIVKKISKSYVKEKKKKKQAYLSFQINFPGKDNPFDWIKFVIANTRIPYDFVVSIIRASFSIGSRTKYIYTQLVDFQSVRLTA